MTLNFKFVDLMYFDTDKDGKKWYIAMEYNEEYNLFYHFYVAKSSKVEYYYPLILNGVSYDRIYSFDNVLSSDVFLDELIISNQTVSCIPVEIKIMLEEAELPVDYTVEKDSKIDKYLLKALSLQKQIPYSKLKHSIVDWLKYKLYIEDMKNKFLSTNIGLDGLLHYLVLNEDLIELTTNNGTVSDMIYKKLFLYKALRKITPENIVSFFAIARMDKADLLDEYDIANLMKIYQYSNWESTQSFVYQYADNKVSNFALLTSDDEYAYIEAFKFFTKVPRIKTMKINSDGNEYLLELNQPLYFKNLQTMVENNAVVLNGKINEQSSTFTMMLKPNIKPYIKLDINSESVISPEPILNGVFTNGYKNTSDIYIEVS